MPGYKRPMYGKKPMLTGETREQIKKREERLQRESRERARKKRENFMSGKKPQFNTKLKKAAEEGKLDGSPKFKSAVERAMMYKPMKHHGPYKLGSMSKNNTEGIFRKEVPQMYHSKKPMIFKGQIRKAVDTAKKADKAYRSEGNKNDPDYMKMMNKRK
jgi:hypothetical protein